MLPSVMRNRDLSAKIFGRFPNLFENEHFNPRSVSLQPQFVKKSIRALIQACQSLSNSLGKHSNVMLAKEFQPQRVFREAS